MLVVQLKLPNRGTAVEGAVIGLDKATARFVVRLHEPVQGLRANLLARAILLVSGTPRELTVELTPISEDTVMLTPVSAAVAHERRTHRRYPVNLPAQVGHGERFLQARVVNISASGMGLQVGEPLPEGELIHLEVPLVDVDAPLRATLEVRHQRPLEGGMWYVGTRFAELARADALLLRKLFP